MSTFAEEMEKIPARVQYGIMFVPGITSDQIRDVNIADLHIGCPENCMIGQIYGNWTFWREQFSIDDQFAVDLGTVAPNFDDAVDLEDWQVKTKAYEKALCAEWIRRITMMRNPVTEIIQPERVLEDA